MLVHQAVEQIRLWSGKRADPDAAAPRRARRATLAAMTEPMLEWDTPMYRLAVAQLDQTAKRMGLDENIWERLRTPQRALIVSFPFRRDDYKTVDTRRSATACSTCSRWARPRAASAIDDDVNLGEVTALAIWMTLEVRADRPAVRRREGRRAHRPERALAHGAAAHHAPLHARRSSR